MNVLDRIPATLARRASHPALVVTAKAALYVMLIVACILFAPEDPQVFIYTEF